MKITDLVKGGYWRSGGAAQALSAPSFLQVNGWSESRVDALVMEKFGQDKNQFEISDDSEFSNIIEATGDIDNNYYSFTGLTEETTYYVRGRAKFGSVYTDWIEQSCYTLTTPLYAYDFRGIGYDETNEYGKTGSPNFSYQVAEAYSYRGTANTLTPTTATLGIMEWQDVNQSRNRGSAYPRFSHNNEYTPASTVDLTGTDFTILWEQEKNNMGAALVNFLSNSANANIYMSMNTGGVRFRFNGGAFYTPLWPASSATSYSKQRCIAKLSGTSLTVGLMNDDDTLSFGSAVTIVAGTIEWNRFFANSTKWYPSILNIYEKALTDAQIKREFKRAEQGTYTFKNNTTHIPQGVTFTDALNGGYYENDDLAHSATAGNSWVNVHTLDDHSIVRLSTKDSLLPDILKVYRHTDGYVSGDVAMGTPGSVVDGHNIGSIFMSDNTYLHIEQDIHYDKGVPSKIVIKKFGNNWNLTEYATMPLGNGISSQIGSHIQYLGMQKAGGAIHIMAQEYMPGTGSRWYTVYTFIDGFNYCEKTRIVDTEGTANRWFYGGFIHSEDSTLRMKFDYIPSITTPAGATGGNGSKYAFTCYLEAPLTDGRINTVHNLMYGYDTGGTGAWSKNIVGNNSPATITELTANAIMGLDGTSKTYSVKATTVYYDPTDGKVYACLTNGDNNGLIFCHSVAGEWVQVTIDLLSHNIVCGYSPSDSVSHGTNTPTIIRTGTNSYELICQEVVSGSYPTQVWKGVKLSTTDTWANSGFVGDLTDTNHHDRISTTHNMHFTGGSTAYNGKRLLVMSKEFTSPDNHSHTKFIDIS